MTHLAPVLGTGDLPFAELQAARLDGELYAVDEFFSPVDSPLTTDARGLALYRALSRFRGLEKRLVAEQWSAAWVWGAVFAPPYPHQFCAPVAIRARENAPQLGHVREVKLVRQEVLTVNGLRLTTPLRTALDLVRSPGEFEPDELAVVGRLLDGAGLAVADCVDALDDRRNIPQKKQALERLARVPERLPLPDDSW